MQTKKSHPSLPPEIWEHTALYLSEREIANASCLSPALAYIAEGNKYQALSIPLHFQDRQPSKGTIEKKAEAELIKLKKEKHSHHVQALYLSSAPLSTTEHIRVQLGSLFRRTESMEPILLDDFIGIKELHLDTLDDHLSTTLPFVDMDRHPFALLVWSHVWTGLVHLSITANSNLGRICQMLPSSTFTQIPLPRLEVMKLKMDTVFWNQENTVAIMRHISHFYLGSKALRCLDLRFLAVDREVLSFLLPSQPEKLFPRLETFGFKATNTKEQEHLRWIPILTAFVVAHKDTLKVLHTIDMPVSAILAPVLLNVQNSMNNVRLDIDVANFHEFQDLIHPRSEAARFICRSLRCLHIPNPIGYAAIDELLQLFALSGHTPHLRTLGLHVALLTLHHLASLARSLPNLDTLHIKFRSYSHQDRVAFMTQLRAHTPKDPLSSWKLRDISLVHDIDDVGLRREKEIMKEFAALIPSISSFNGSGDTV